jgi:hypothetical protein
VWIKQFTRAQRTGIDRRAELSARRSEYRRPKVPIGLLPGEMARQNTKPRGLTSESKNIILLKIYGCQEISRSFFCKRCMLIWKSCNDKAAGTKIPDAGSLRSQK